jgi:hypothetical protein
MRCIEANGINVFRDNLAVNNIMLRFRLFLSRHVGNSEKGQR